MITTLIQKETNHQIIIHLVKYNLSNQNYQVNKELLQMPFKDI